MATGLTGRDFDAALGNLEGAAQDKESEAFKYAVISMYKALVVLSADGTRERLTEAWASIDVLRRRLDKLGAYTEDFNSDLAAVSGVIGDALSAMDVRRQDARTERSLVGLRDRIRELLGSCDRPLRNSDIAKELDVDPTQISRALRELVKHGWVREAPAEWATDRRERWYEGVRERSMELISGVNDLRAEAKSACAVFVLRPVGSSVWLGDPDVIKQPGFASRCNQVSDALFGFGSLWSTEHRERLKKST